MIRNRQTPIRSAEEFKKIVKMISDCANHIYFEKYTKQPIGLNAYVEQTEKFIKITFKLCKTKTTYVFSRDDEYITSTTVANAMSELSRTYKVQRVEEILNIKPDKTINPVDGKPNNFRENIGSAQPHRFNINKTGKEKIYETKAYEYDLSQAYAQMLKLPLPDITKCRTDDKLLDDEIGFVQLANTKTGTKLVMVEKPGMYCDWCFKKMESPYIDLMNRWMTQIAECADEDKKVDIKNKPRYAVGQLQNINPFWRATIVERCNQLIKSLSDENTIYSNTDSIVSKVERKDIAELEMFKFKQKHQGDTFRLSSDNKDIYQWNDELPTMSGITKLAIKYYNATHVTPFILNETPIPEVIGHHWDIKGNKDYLELVENTIGE